MFARRYFAPRYWPSRYWVKSSVAPVVINTVATPKLASHVDLPRFNDTSSAFGRWANDLILRLQRAFETIIYTLNAVSITDVRANRVDRDLLNGSFFTSTDVGVTYVAHNDVWYAIAASSGAVTTTAATTYEVTRADAVLLVDATAGTCTVTIPSAALHTDRHWHIKKIDASGNAVNLVPAAAGTIDGATPYALASQWDTAHIVSNGTAWFIV
jgi:hypothetical protein